MMRPGPLRLGLEFIPTDLRFRILKGALGEGAAATSRDQPCLGGACRGMEQRLRTVAIALASDHQPFGAGSLAGSHRPDAPHREVCDEAPTFRGPHLALLPYRLWMLGQGAYLLGALIPQLLQPRARPASLALLRG